MTINTKNILDNTIWWVLQEMAKESASAKEGDLIRFMYQDTENCPSRNDHRRATEWLAKNKCLVINKYT